MRLSRRGVIVALVVVLIAAGIVYVSAKLLSRGETVLYQEPDSTGPDPFTDPAVFISDVEPVTTSTTTTAVAPSPSPSATASPPITTTQPAIPTTQPAQGPFGGSGKKGECDPEKLIEFLNESPERKEAWAGVLELDVEEVDDYIRSLTPVVLSRDTRITNYGFKDGKAYAFQSILAEGTAVLIDSQGELVVRCYCGNPLTPPRQIKYTCDGCPPDYTPPPPCEQTCYPTPTTTTTTLPPTTTTTTAVGQSTTTTRRVTTTTGVSGSITTTRPGGSTTTTRPTTTTSPATSTTGASSTTMCLLGLCGILN